MQVACTQTGTLIWVSDPRDGRLHDTEALRRSGLLDVPTTDLSPGVNPPSYISDKGYIGLGVITPRREPANLSLHPDDKTYNQAVNQIRYKIEQVVASMGLAPVVWARGFRPLGRGERDDLSMARKSYAEELASSGGGPVRDLSWLI